MRPDGDESSLMDTERSDEEGDRSRSGEADDGSKRISRADDCGFHALGGEKGCEMSTRGEDCEVKRDVRKTRKEDWMLKVSFPWIDESIDKVFDSPSFGLLLLLFLLLVVVVFIIGFVWIC